MKRPPLVYLMAPIAAQLLGCVADISGVSPSAGGGVTDLGGSTGPGTTGGVPDGGSSTGGAPAFPPGSSGGSTGIGIPSPGVGTGGTSGTGGRSGTGGTPASAGGGTPVGVTGGGMAVGATGGAPVGTAGGTTACATNAVPILVQSMLNGKCLGCHGSTPLPGAPSLRTFADLTGPSRTDPSRTAAAMMLARIQSTVAPMPPAGGTPASAAELAALRDWVSASYQTPCPTTPPTGGSAGTASGAGTGAGGAPGVVVVPPPAGPDPFAVGATCTSRTTAGGGESATMAPGQACINCHRNGGGGEDEGESEAPIFSIAGTLYPTGHEPNNCNGMNGSSGARIVITGANGVVLTLTPNSAGNFTSQARVTAPFRAKVTYQGRERLMLSTQTNGDCNACHTQNGASLAPGRIVLP